MNFTAVVAEVLGIVKRADKTLEIRREVNAAVSFYCQDSDFKRDIEEVALVIAPLEYSANIPFASLPRFRKIQWMKRGGTKCYLDEVNVSKLTKNICNTDKYYIAGSGIRYNVGALGATMDIAYFQYPPLLTDSAGDFWMLDLQPYMIIDRAASKIFNSIGDDASSKRHEGFANQVYLSWRTDQLVSR